jgi:hypothetical protein
LAARAEQPATRTAPAAATGGRPGLTISADPGHRGRIHTVLTRNPGPAAAAGATGPEEHPTPTTSAADTTTSAAGSAATALAEPARVTTGTTGTPHTARGGVPAAPGRPEPPSTAPGPAVEAVTARARQQPPATAGTRGGPGATQRIEAVAVTDQQPRIRTLSSPIGEQHRQTTQHRTLLRRSPHHLRRGPRHHTRRNHRRRNHTRRNHRPQQRIRRRRNWRWNRHRHRHPAGARRRRRRGHAHRGRNRNRHRGLSGPSRPRTGARLRRSPGNPAPHDTIPDNTVPHDTVPHDTVPHDTLSAHRRRRTGHRTRRTTPTHATTAARRHRPAIGIRRPRRTRPRGIPTTTIGMSHTRRQQPTHTQTQTHRTHPKPRIGLTPTTRPTTTGPAGPTPVPRRQRNHLGAHSPIHQPISLK